MQVIKRLLGCRLGACPCKVTCPYAGDIAMKILLISILLLTMVGCTGNLFIDIVGASGIVTDVGSDMIEHPDAWFGEDDTDEDQMPAYRYDPITKSMIPIEEE